MSTLPDTASRKTSRRWPERALAAMGVVAALLVMFGILRDWGFSPGEQLRDPGFKDIAVSEENTLYPPSDVLVFDHPPDVVYVYVAVKDLADRGGIEARVRYSGTGSVLSGVFSDKRIQVFDVHEEQLAPSRAGVSGVVKFGVRAGDGRRLSAGNYTVSFYRADGREAVARKHFVIRR